MPRKDSIDLRNLLNKQAIAKSGQSAKGAEQDENRPGAERDLPEPEHDEREMVREAPPKHLPRPTRR